MAGLTQIRFLVLAAAVIAAGVSCERVAVESTHARVVLNAETPRPTIDVIDAPAHVLQALESPGLDWTKVMKVSAGPNQPALQGQYGVVDGRVRFTPMFPLHRGRRYVVTFAPEGERPVSSAVTLPAMDVTPTTIVDYVFPSAALVPANLTHFYVQFSAPMDPRGAQDFIRLVDDGGNEIHGAFAPLADKAWNDDRTMCAIALDDAARALVEGRQYELRIDPAWRDHNGVALKQPFRRSFTVGAADASPIDPGAWKITAPAAGTIGAIVIIFPEPLNHESVSKALGVIGPDKKPIRGQASIGAGELTWTFAPDEPWQAGAHAIVAGAPLQDLAGNGTAGPLQLPITIR